MSEPLDDDDRRLRQELPWLVNGSLPPAEREAIEQALHQRPALRSERAFFERLREAVRGQETAMPGDAGWQRLRAQIETTPVATRAAANDRWWRPLAIAASVLFAVQAVWVWGPFRADEAYAPQGTSGQQIGADVVLLQVRPRADARLGDWQALLLRLNAQVVSGPGAAGVYRIAVPRAQADAALAALRAAGDVVEHAAPE